MALVTGGASGIGAALCRALAKGGTRVVVADVRGRQATALAKSIVDAGGIATSATLDVTDARAVRELVESTWQKEGRLDLMFNNAGVALAADALDHELADWDRILDVNLRGVVHGVLAAYPLMVKQGFGHIINTASVAGLIPAVGQIGYVTTKHALVGLSMALRAEAADLGVRVSVVCPGFVDTPLLREHLIVKDGDQVTDGSRADVLRHVPFRALAPEAAARSILRGVRRNRGLITVTAHGRLLVLLQRLSPALMLHLTRLTQRRMRRVRGSSPSELRINPESKGQ